MITMAVLACLFLATVDRGVYAIIDHSYVTRGHIEETACVFGGALRHGYYAVQTPGDETLHANEGIKFSDSPSLPESIGLLQVSLPVYGERVMYSSYYWSVQPFHQKQSVTKALIVVYNVKATLSAKLLYLGINPEAECPGLGEDS
jgi:hypothetical protein